MGIKNLLDIPFVYNATQLFLGMDFLSVSASYIEKYPHASILEIGCGPGTLIKYLHGVKSYLGVDINDTYVSYAQKKYGSKEIKFIQADVTNFPKIGKSFDLIIIVNVIHHLSDKELNVTLKKIAKNVNFKKLILLDSKPYTYINSLNIALEKADQGSNFRELPAAEKIFKKHLRVIKSEILKKPYWLYKYLTIVAEKK